MSHVYFRQPTPPDATTSPAAERNDDVWPIRMDATWSLSNPGRRGASWTDRFIEIPIEQLASDPIQYMKWKQRLRAQGRFEGKLEGLVYGGGITAAINATVAAITAWVNEHATPCDTSQVAVVVRQTLIDTVLHDDLLTCKTLELFLFSCLMSTAFKNEVLKRLAA